MNRRQGQPSEPVRAAARPSTDPHTLNTALRAWASVIDSISDLVFMHDETGCLMRVNRAYAARAGARPADLLGRSFREVLPEAGSPNGAATPCANTEEAIVLAAGGTYSARTLPVHDGAGAPVCCIHILRERAVPTTAAEIQASADAVPADSERRLRHNLEATIEAFATAIELNEPHNAGHGRRVATLGVAIGQALRLSAAELEGIRIAAQVHDVGSFKIPIDVLVKPGKLTAVERLLVQSHPEVGHRILRSIEFPWPIAEIVLQHHERSDGAGYPRGLAGTAILIEAKVIAVADAMEAMLSNRPYRPGLGVDGALRELADQRGSSYDPAIVDACVQLFTRGFVLE